MANKGKPPKGSNGNGSGSGSGGTTTPTDPTSPPPPPTTSGDAGVILLDFDGYTVSGTLWNVAGNTINCTPANLTSDAVTKIISRVQNDYAPFNIIVTTDE